MKKTLNNLVLCLAAIVVMIAIGSCRKVNDREYNNLLTINGETVPLESIAMDFDDEIDGVTILPGIAEDYPLGSLIIQFATSLIGTKVDLSVMDVYAPTIATHYVHSVYFKKDDEYIYLSWGADFDTTLADVGSYILVKDLGDSNYQIDMYCKSNGYEVELHYHGHCDPSPL